MFLLYMGERPTPRWGAKTPSNVFWTRELHAMYPQAKFVFLYRDGRDVSIDQVNTHWGPMNLFNACHLWDHYTKAMLQAKKNLPKDCYHELDYEKMVNDPQDEIAALCAFLDLEYEPSMLNFFANGDDPFFSQSHHLKADNPITNDYVGLYKSLPLEDRQLQVALIGRRSRNWATTWMLSPEK